MLLTDSNEFVRRATVASNAFAQLRDELDEANEHRPLPPLGTMLGGRYLLEREIGQGGFGSVFEVSHHLLGHRFAMKLLNPRIASDPNWVKRFEEEARATSLIGHESIVYVTDFGTDPEWGSYFVMEYLDGEPLEEHIARDGPQPIDRVFRFARAAAGALGAVHDLGIVHCDLKPSNVFVLLRKRQPELFKFLDFGTSTVVMSAVETDVLYGTPRYMAPEQAVGLEITPQSDQFAVAMIIYEMLTGDVPWDVRSWLQATPIARSQNPPIPPSQLGASPPSWDAPILRALSIQPSDRFGTVGEFVDHLEPPELDWAPSIDPLDVRREAGADSFARTMTAPSVRIVRQEADASQSLVVDVPSNTKSGADVPAIEVVFGTHERFVREWRRNLVAGGLFVPTDDLVDLRSTVALELEYRPTAALCRIHATVVRHETRAEHGRGFGVAIDPAERPRLDAFARPILSPGLEPEARLRPAGGQVEGEDLKPGEWFVLSRVESTGTTVARLRAMCAGLPFDISDILARLLEHELLVVERADSPELSGEAVQSGVVGSAHMDRRDIDQIVERCDVYAHRGNFLAASGVLERALEVNDHAAALHFRLAQLCSEYEPTSARARRAAERAAELEPDNEDYQEFVRTLDDR